MYFVKRPFEPTILERKGHRPPPDPGQAPRNRRENGACGALESCCTRMLWLSQAGHRPGRNLPQTFSGRSYKIEIMLVSRPRRPSFFAAAGLFQGGGGSCDARVSPTGRSEALTPPSHPQSVFDYKCLVYSSLLFNEMALLPDRAGQWPSSYWFYCTWGHLLMAGLAIGPRRQMPGVYFSRGGGTEISPTRARFEAPHLAAGSEIQPLDYKCLVYISLGWGWGQICRPG